MLSALARGWADRVRATASLHPMLPRRWPSKAASHQPRPRARAQAAAHAHLALSRSDEQLFVDEHVVLGVAAGR